MPFVCARPLSKSISSIDWPRSGASFWVVTWFCNVSSPSPTPVSLRCRRRRRLRLRLLCGFSSLSSGISMPASRRIRWTTGPISNCPYSRSWLVHGLYLKGKNQSYQWSPITDRKFWYKPRSKGLSPGFVCKIANVLTIPDDEYDIVRKVGSTSATLGM